MGTPSHILDHQERAVARLTQQFRDGVSVPNLVRALTGGLQEIEDAVHAIRASRAIGVATGAQLDLIGRIVGQPREGRVDDVYRIWLRARVRVNRGSGTPEDLLSVFASVTQGSTAIVLEEQFPAGFVLRVGSTSIIDPAELAALLRLARVAGVYAIVESATTIDTTSFAFDSNGAGYGDVNDPGAGGTYATAIV
jgi:hypothetical protein